MKKFLILIVAVFALAGCGGGNITQSIVDAGVERIDRAQTAIKNTETLDQCKTTAADALLSAKVDILNAGESCKREINNLKSDLARWKTYFWLLIISIGVAVYLYIVRKIKDVI